TWDARIIASPASYPLWASASKRQRRTVSASSSPSCSNCAAVIVPSLSKARGLFVTLAAGCCPAQRAGPARDPGRASNEGCRLEGGRDVCDARNHGSKRDTKSARFERAERHPVVPRETMKP